MHRAGTRRCWPRPRNLVSPVFSRDNGVGRRFKYWCTISDATSGHRRNTRPQPTRPTMQIKSRFRLRSRRPTIPGLIGLFFSLRPSTQRPSVKRQYPGRWRSSPKRSSGANHSIATGLWKARSRRCGRIAHSISTPRPGRRPIPAEAIRSGPRKRGNASDVAFTTICPLSTSSPGRWRGWKATNSSARRSSSTRRPGFGYPGTSTFRRTYRSPPRHCSSCTSGAARCSSGRIASAARPCIPS